MLPAVLHALRSLGDPGSSLPVSGMSHEPKSPSLGMLSTATRTTATVNPLTPSPLNGALVPSGSPATSSALSAQAAPSSSFAAALRKLAKQAEEPRGKRCHGGCVWGALARAPWATDARWETSVYGPGSCPVTHMHAHVCACSCLRTACSFPAGSGGAGCTAYLGSQLHFALTLCLLCT